MTGSERHRGTLFLIPNLIGEGTVESSLPPVVAQVIRSLTDFLVEEEKSARRLIKTLYPEVDLRSLNLARLNEHTDDRDLPMLLAPLSEGRNMGVISEAGLPAVADPGSNAVRLAHQLGATVQPLVGPCSMMLALMSSGLNGQRWRFLGYLPIGEQERRTAIQDLEQTALQSGETQICMDAPYRNQRLLGDLLRYCKPSTLLCIARNLLTDRQSIALQSIAEWRKDSVVMAKEPALFLIGSD